MTDQDKRAIFYNEHLLDAVVKCLAMKAHWQISTLAQLGYSVILFIDEPYLASFGSVYINLSRKQVIAFLKEIIDAIYEAGGVPGVHCCANTDWSILMETKVKILNFDAHNYYKSITLYPEMLREFYEKGGVVDWGIIPASEDIEKESLGSLCASLDQKMKELSMLGIPIERIRAQSLITASCGMGSIEKDRAEKIAHLACGISEWFHWRGGCPARKGGDETVEVPRG